MNANSLTLEILQRALASEDPSIRFRVAQAAGIEPKPEYVDPLVDQFAVETEFFVLDMLTWALIQNDRAKVIERCLVELKSPIAQSRAQSLHTLSKLGDETNWMAITDELLTDSDDQVARTAWRTAEILVPVSERPALAKKLCELLGRGEREVQRSLSRVLRDLGVAATEPLRQAAEHPDVLVREHAKATEALIAEDESQFDASIREARRRELLTNAPMVDQSLLD